MIKTNPIWCPSTMDVLLKVQSSPVQKLALIFTPFLLTTTAVVMVSCASPEEKKKQRQELLSKYVTGVAQHLYDRNPDTVRESVTHLFREELTDPVKEKLQSQGQIPKTELGIVKILTEAEEQHTTNSVNVTNVKPLGPVEKDVVPFQVTGVVTTKTEGKPNSIKPFSIKVSCKLNDDTGGWPQVVDVSGMIQETKQTQTKEVSARGKKHKRRRH